jgi:hypothetical protein
VAYFYHTFDTGTDGENVTLADSGNTGGNAFSYLFVNNASTPGGSSVLQYSSAAAVEGGMGVRLTPTATTSYLRWDAAGGARGVMRLPIRFPNNPTDPGSAVTIAQIRNSSNQLMAGVLIRNTGHIRATDNAASVAASAYQLLPNTLYWAELAVTKGTTTTDGRIELKVYSADGTTEIFTWDSGTTLNTGTANVDQIRFGGGLGTSSGWAYQDIDSIQFDTDRATGWLGPLDVAADAPTLTITRPAENIVDLRSSAPATGQSPLTWPAPTHVSGPLLTSTSLANGLWLFSQSNEQASVYTVSIVQADNQTNSADVTINPLPVSILHANAPLIPNGTTPGSNWA